MISHAPQWLMDLLPWARVVVAVVLTVSAVIAVRLFRLHSKQSYATFILALDERWESREFNTVRSTIRQEKQKIEHKVHSLYRSETPDVKREKFKEVSHEHLNNLRKNDKNTYDHFMSAWGFLETVGHLMKGNRRGRRDINEVFGYIVLQLDDISRLHIAERNEEEKRKVGFDPHLYSNFLDLAAKLRKLNQ